MMYSRYASHRLCALLFLPGCVVLVVALIFLGVTTHTAEAASPHVDVMVFNSDVGPASLRFLTRALDTAAHDGAQALVIEIDTPGGDIDTMKTMTQEELASSVPVVAYVSPTGGRAASAGAFVTLAAQVAAMAPTTRIGASSPITSSGGDIGNTLKAKIENDLSQSIKGIQTRYGRNVPLAIQMVTNAASYDDTTAVKDDLVDLSAPSLSGLLNELQGRVVKLNSGRSVTLQTAGAEVDTIDASALDTFYAFIIDPNIVFLLFIIAMIGLYVEISHPGAILPGVAGSIALLLFLFAIGSLSPNWAGLALMVLSFVLLILDVRLPTHGVLTVGAVIALIIGSFLFFGSSVSYGGPLINPVVVYGMGGVIGVIGLTLVTLILRARHHVIATGTEGMIGAMVVAVTSLSPIGRVRYAGEDWSAVLDAPALPTSVDAGTELRIVAVEGLRLRVRPVGTLSIGNTHSVSTFE